MAAAKNYVKVNPYKNTQWVWNFLTFSAKAKYVRFLITKGTNQYVGLGEVELFDSNHNLIPKSVYQVTGTIKYGHEIKAICDGNAGEAGADAWCPYNDASKTSPSTAMISLDKEYDISALAAAPLFYGWLNCGDVQIQEFCIQFSNDPTCAYTDALESEKWFGVDLMDGDYSGSNKWNCTIGEGTTDETVQINLTATAGDAKVTLNWNAVTGATGYNVKRSTTAGGPYTAIAPNVSGTTYVDTTVQNGTTYYYVVTAVTANGESGNSNEASATPQAAPVDTSQAILRVTMIDSSEREFQLTTSEIDGFINWFNHHASTDTASFMFNKTIGVQTSKEYLAFDKIISFEVIPVA